MIMQIQVETRNLRLWLAVATVTEMRSCCFGRKRIMINFRFGSFLPGFQAYFVIEQEKHLLFTWHFLSRVFLQYFSCAKMLWLILLISCDLKFFFWNVVNPWRPFFSRKHILCPFKWDIEFFTAVNICGEKSCSLILSITSFLMEPQWVLKGHTHACIVYFLFNNN